MQDPIFDPKAARKPTNLSVNSDLLRQARALGVNLSQVLEQGLIQILQQERQARWCQENQAALEAFNDHIARDGVFSDGLRSF